VITHQTRGRRGRATASALVRASHAGPTAVVTLLAGALAVGLAAPAATVVLVVLAVLAGQLSIGWSNDWLDAARDLRAGRTDKPVVRGVLSARMLRVAALGAAATCVVLSLATGPAAGTVHVIAVALAWAYNLGLKGTAWSWSPYAVSFGLLPLFVVLALPGAALPQAWVPLVGALLGVGAHLTNALPDLEDDLRTGIRGLPHRLGRGPTAVLAPAVLAVGVLVAVGGTLDAQAGGLAGHLAPAVVLLLGAVAVLAAGLAGTVAVRRPSSRLPFTLAMLVAVLCVVVLVGAGPAALRP
jgi:4-hydroxybenzoate polyprenyltransferase